MTDNTTSVSRREFARRAALAAAASLAPASALEATLPSDSQPIPGPAAQTQAPNAPKLSPESQIEVDSRIQTILGQYGSRLSDEQKADIRRLATLAQPPLDRLRAYHVENGDDPALYLKPLVEREKKPAPGGAPPAVPKQS